MVSTISFGNNVSTLHTIVNMDQPIRKDPMPDRGSVTENHYDHVHVSMN